MSDAASIQVTCDGCRKRFRVKTSSIGKRVRCPHESCGNVLIVPDPVGQDAEDPAPLRRKTAPEKSTSEPKKSSPVRTSRSPVVKSRFWRKYVLSVVFLELVFGIVFAWQLGLFSLLTPAPPPGVAKSIRTEKLLLHAGQDTYTARDPKDIVLVMQLQGVSAKQLQGTKGQADVEVAGKKHPCPIANTQTGFPDRVTLAAIAPREEQQMTLHLGGMAPMPFCSDTPILPQWEMPGLDEPVLMIVAGILTIGFPILALVGAIVIAVWRWLRKPNPAI